MRHAVAIGLIGFCFTAGWLSGRWMDSGPPAETTTLGTTGKRFTAVSAEPTPPPNGTIQELKAIRAQAAGIAPTLDGLLAVADQPPELTAEAVIIEALRPLGLEKWRELFAGLKKYGRDGAETRMHIVRRALLRLWAAEDPAGAMRALAHQYPGEPVSPDDSAMVARQLLRGPPPSWMKKRGGPP